MTADEIVREISRRAWSFGVAVLLIPSDHVKIGDSACSGYFDGDADVPLLVVATKQPEERWLGILLHEYSHLTQWVEKCPAWTNTEGQPDFHGWLDGTVRGTAASMRKAMVATRECEADCERRTVRLIKELQAPIDLDRYCRAANAYLHFHNTMLKKRSWFAADKRPYNMPEVLAVCNPTIDADVSKTPKALQVELEKCIKQS